MPALPTTPLITVIMPLYNAASRYPHYLHLAITSVLAQTHTNFELILIDDGSTDDYAPFKQHYAHEPRLKWLHQTNQGQSAARNRAARQGSGEYLAFIDQDDAWYPTWLTTALDTAQKHQSVFVYADVDQIDASGTLLQQSYFTSTGRGIHPKRHLAHVIGTDCYVVPTTSFISRAAFLTHGGFNQALAGYEDDDLYRRLFHAGPTHFIATAQARWRTTTTSASFSLRMDESRLHYCNILLNAYPRAVVRKLVVPRFFKLFSGVYRQAAAANNPARLQIARTGLAKLKPYSNFKFTVARMALLALPRPAFVFWQHTAQTSALYGFISKQLGHRK